MEGGTDNDFLKGLVKRKWRGASGGIVRAAAASGRSAPPSSSPPNTTTTLQPRCVGAIFFTALYDSAATEINAANFLPSQHLRGAARRGEASPSLSPSQLYCIFGKNERQPPTRALVRVRRCVDSTGIAGNGFLPS